MHTGANFDIDWAADGKFVGFISFPYSIDRSPYYSDQEKPDMPDQEWRRDRASSSMAGNHAGDRV